MKRFYSLVLTALAVLLLPMASSWGAMTVYQFTSGTGSQITLTSPSTLLGSGNDDAASAVTNIGFNFVFNGTTYTQFSASSNGLLGLGSTTVTTSYSNPVLTASATYPIITAFWRDMYTTVDGGVLYQLMGSSPNRILAVEWRVNACCSGTSYGTTYQVRLYEGSNKIEFWYGNNTNSLSSAGIGAAASNSDYVSISGGSASYTSASANNSFPSSGTLYTLSPCSANVTIAGNTGQGGTAAMANNDVIFSGMTTQRGNSTAYQPFTVTNPSNACASRTYTYTLGGANANNYQLSNTSGSLAGSQTSTPTITFTPSGLGVRTATLTVTDDNGFSRTYTLSAQGSTRINWIGNIAQGGTATVASGDTLMSNISVQRLGSGNFTPVTVSNFNTNAAAPPAPVTVSINDPSGQFSISGPATASLGANQSYSPVIRFAPTGVGFQNATLTITADGETRTFPLKAYATAPGGEFFVAGTKLSPSVPLYSNQFGCVGEVAFTQQLTVLNVGSGDFVINSIDVYKTDTVYGQGAPRYPLMRDRNGNPIRMNDYFITDQPGVAPPSANQRLQLPLSIPQGQSRTLYITYVGQETGKRFGRLMINTNGQNFLGNDINNVSTTGLLVVDLFGNGIGGHLSDNLQGGTPKTMVFQPIRVGDSLDATYTLFNTGDCDLRISLAKLSITSGDVQDFRLLTAFGRTIVEGVPMTGDAVLAPAASGTFTVRFKPQRNGSRRATLWMQTNDSTVNVNGVSERGSYYLDLYGVGKAYLDYTNLKLKPAVIGSGVSSVGTIRVVNSSTATVGIQSITLVGGDAAQFAENGGTGAWPPTPYNVAPGAEMLLGISMTPTGTPGARATTLRIVTTTGETIDIAITGEAGSQALTVSPGRLFVGAAVIAAEEKREMVTISNTGTLPIRILSATISGPAASDYFLGTLPRLVLEPGAVEYLEVTYRPAVSGVTSTATLTIVSDAGTQTVSLEGTSLKTRGVDPTGIVTGSDGTGQPEISLNMGSTSSVREAAAAAAGVRFEAVRPNPARDRAELVYALAKGADVRLALYDGAGRLVREIAGGSQAAGEHRVSVDVSDLTAGAYHCRLTAGGLELSQTVVVVR